MAKSEAKCRSVWLQSPCAGLCCHRNPPDQFSRSVPPKVCLRPASLPKSLRNPGSVSEGPGAPVFPGSGTATGLARLPLAPDSWGLRQTPLHQSPVPTGEPAPPFLLKEPASFSLLTTQKSAFLGKHSCVHRQVTQRKPSVPRACSPGQSSFPRGRALPVTRGQLREETQAGQRTR